MISSKEYGTTWAACALEAPLPLMRVDVHFSVSRGQRKAALSSPGLRTGGPGAGSCSKGGGAIAEGAGAPVMTAKNLAVELYSSSKALVLLDRRLSGAAYLAIAQKSPGPGLTCLARGNRTRL